MNCKDKQNGVQLPITYFRPTFEISVHQNYQAKIKYVYITVQSATLHCINKKTPPGYLNTLLPIHSTAHTGKLDWCMLAKLFIGQPTKQES